MKFRVGEKVKCKNRTAVIVSRYKHDRETPYRIKFSDGRQIQVSEDLLSKHCEKCNT